MSLKVKSILISQPKPETDKNPYYELAKKLNLKVDFRPFIQVDPIPAKDLRKEKLNLLDYSAVILNSRNAVDNYFRLAAEMKVELPAEMKYFCINEGTALYIQKYIVMRKRKVFYGKGTEKDLLDLIKSHSDENFLFPCSDIRKPEVPDFLTKNNIKFREAIIYKTVSADLSDLADVYYDILVFFSPADIKSLFENFPDFKQNNTRIAAFGGSTARAVEEAGLVLNIPAPTPESPSMTGAMEKYIVAANKGH